jgi:hypothetical protein
LREEALKFLLWRFFMMDLRTKFSSFKAPALNLLTRSNLRFEIARTLSLPAQKLSVALDSMGLATGALQFIFTPALGSAIFESLFCREFYFAPRGDHLTNCLEDVSKNLSLSHLRSKKIEAPVSLMTIDFSTAP